MNTIRLAGRIGDIKYSHEAYGKKFYKAYVSSERASGNIDTLPVIIRQELKDKITTEKVCIVGEIRTRNVHYEDGKSHLDIFAYCKDIEDYVVDENAVVGNGIICKPPIYRITPLLRCISDLLIACNRNNGYSDYIPSVAWGRNADRVAEYSVGTAISYEGRLQSRQYIKSGETEERTAYELSLSDVEVKGGNDNE